MTSKLTEQQCQQVRELAATGAMLFDVLVVLGFSPTEADELSQDNAIIDEHRRGRSAGAVEVRKALIRAGEKGTVSALNAINKLNKEADKLELYPTKRKASAVRVDVVGSVDALFAKLRLLHEGVPLESKLVTLKPRKVSDNG
jgi:hypothetical protein